MGILQLARKDSMFTMEGEISGSQEFTLEDKGGNSWNVRGIVGDIGLLFDTDGNAVAGRTVCANYRSENVSVGGQVADPERGWRFSYTDLSGKKWTLFVLFAAPDKVLGITKIWLVLDLSKAEATGND